MPTFRVSISKQNPPAIAGVYDYAQTVVANDQNSAIASAYQSWSSENKGQVPALNQCYVSAVQK
jgi:hypothetical protein